MKIRTKDLIGPALDWAAAKAEDNEDCRDPYVTRTLDGMETYVKVTTFSGYEADWEPSVDWSQAGPIIEREKITLDYDYDGQGLSLWTARKCAFDGTLLWAESGDSPLIAAMRCFVASRLGDEVEIPGELCK